MPRWPEVAEPLVDRFVERLRDSAHRVATGRFGADMDVELVNDGPFTLVLDRRATVGGGLDLLGGSAAARAGLDADHAALAADHHRL